MSNFQTAGNHLKALRARLAWALHCVNGMHMEFDFLEDWAEHSITEKRLHRHTLSRDYLREFPEERMLLPAGNLKQ